MLSRMLSNLWTSIFAASMHSNFPVQHQLQGPGSSSTLHIAVLGGSAKAVEFLLANNSTLIHKTNKRQETPLHWACKGGNFKIVELLLLRGASPTAEDSEGNTPVHWAARYNKSRILRILCAHGGSCIHRNNRGYSPLEVAEAFDSSSTAKVIRKIQREEVRGVRSRASVPSLRKSGPVEGTELGVQSEPSLRQSIRRF